MSLPNNYETVPLNYTGSSAKLVKLPGAKFQETLQETVKLSKALEGTGYNVSMVRMCDNCHSRVSPTCEGYHCEKCSEEFDLCDTCVTKNSTTQCPNGYGCNK